jgi:beta-lactamase regulating signal transducer with metallopeptidase domain
MTDDGGRTERMLESSLGALSDWLELVRQHENERRARLAEVDRARRDGRTRAVMMALVALTIALAFWLAHGRG